VSLFFFFSTIHPPPTSTLFPYTTLFRSKPGSRSTFGYFIKVKQNSFDKEGNKTSEEREYFVLFSYDLIKFKNKNGVEETICATRSEEHTSELQSRGHLVCRLLLEKKKKK